MAKRVRSSARPAAKRAPTRRPGDSAARPAPPAPVAPRAAEPLGPIDIIDDGEEMPRASSGHLTEDEFARAEAIQDEIAARERAAIADQVKRRNRERLGAPVVDDINAPLKVRAAHEYAYVARDVRRIVLTGGLMVGILATIAVLVNVLGVINL